MRTEYCLSVAVHWTEAEVEVGVEAGVGVGVYFGLGEWVVSHQDNCWMDNQEESTREYHLEVLVAVAERARRAVALQIFLSAF